MIDLSKLPETSVRPPGEKATEVTTPVCPGSVSRRWPRLPEPPEMPNTSATSATTATAPAMPSRSTRPCLFVGHAISRQSTVAAGIDVNETGIATLCALAPAAGAAPRLPVSFLRSASAAAAAA